MKNKTLSIRKVVSCLNNEDQDGGFWLPNIQRPFVWKEEQIEKLFDSIMREYPISTLLVWKTKSGIKRRRFIDYYIDDIKLSQFQVAEDHKNKMLVLDGQQRLQSLFIALKGSFNKKELFFNLLSGKENNPEDMRYKFRFMDSEKAEYPWIKFKNIVFTNNLMPTDYAHQVLLTNGVTAKDEEFNIISRNYWQAQKVFVNQDAVNYQELDSVDDPETYTEDDVVEIFIRANSGGTTLGKSDLLFSLLTASWSDADEAMEDLISELNTSGYAFSRDFIMKTCLVLLDKGAAYDVKKFRDNSTKQLMIDQWPQISDAIRDVRDYLFSKTYVRSDQALPSYLTLIPLIYFRYKYREKWTSKTNINTYLFRTLLSGAFSGRPDSLIDKCVRRINKESDFIVSSIFETIHNDGRNLDISDETIFHAGYGSKIIHLIFNIWYSQFDYKPAYQGNLPEVDHIFPQSLLRSVKIDNPLNGNRSIMRYQASKRDCLGNCMLLTSEENGFQSKNDTPPNEWFSDKSPEYLELHLIPKNPELWELDNYEEFIVEREQLIIEKFRPLLKNLCLGDESLSLPNKDVENTERGEVEKPELVLPVMENLAPNQIESQAEETETLSGEEEPVFAVKNLMFDENREEALFSEAESILDSFFDRISIPSKYIAGFRTQNGLELALERTAKKITLWTENAGSYKDQDFVPSKTYEEKDPRNSNLNRKNSPRLRLGFSVINWKLEDIDQLMDFVNWYSQSEMSEV
jgi:hypothetical protein